MSLFWPIIWIGSILAAVLAFAVTALRENARVRAASLARQPKVAPVSEADAMPDESIESLDGFPTQSFDFGDESTKS